MFAEPKIEKHNGIYVVRDDLIDGGTKSRYLIDLFNAFDEVVYATPAYGGAQLALAYCAKLKGKQATLFVAKRKDPHKRTLQAKSLGARVFQVPHGYLNHVQSKAKKYAKDKGAYYLEFGGDTTETIETIGRMASTINIQIKDIDEVWCASGSGVLTRGLQNGIKAKRFYAVQVGKDIKGKVGKATIIKHRLEFKEELNIKTPFPSCPNYDKKAWELCKKHSKGKVLFWNVMG